MNEAAQIAIQGARRLAHLVDARGRFLYRDDPDHPDRRPGYNLLRHAGTIWAMVDVANRLGPLPDVTSAAERAARWLVKKRILPYQGARAACVVSNDRVKLGGNGLAILALLELANGDPKTNASQDHVAVARRLAEYVLLQRKPSGHFIHKRRYSTDEVLPFESDYYTGEVLFGLLRLFVVTGETKWLDLAVDTEAVLAREDYGVKEQSHWMLYALEALHHARPDAVYADHARRIALHIVNEPEYRTWDRSTPIACRSEGLIAYVRMARTLPASEELDTHIEQCLHIVRENLLLQVKYRRGDGSFTRGGGSREVRIDYVQHNVSSYLSYYALEGHRLPPPTTPAPP